MALNSQDKDIWPHGFWVCDVLHCRTFPKPHQFKNQLFWYGLNLSAIDSLPNWFGLFSTQKPALVRFCDSDFFPTASSSSISERVLNFARQNGLQQNPDHYSVLLLGQLRTLGYLFNPIALYLVISQNDEPLCAIAEVTNTFYEHKAFMIQRTHWNPETREAAFESSMPKNFYVSPFLNLNLNFSFKLKINPTRIALTVNSVDEAQVVQIHTALSGSYVPFRFFSLLSLLIRFPLFTLQIITAIHWQAFRLWLKKVPYHRKEEHPHLQTDLLSHR
jgi:DUF1365 family protein